MSYATHLPAGVAAADGLGAEDGALARELVRVWLAHKPRNDLRDDYYLGHVGVKDIGIAMPASLARRIDPRCDWPRKAVLALANRSRFDGYTSSDEATRDELERVVYRNGLQHTYRKAVIDELVHCVSALAVTSDGAASPMPLVHSYPATAMSLVWDDDLMEVKAGLVIQASRLRPDGRTREPTAMRMFTAGHIIDLRLAGGIWAAEYTEHSMGRPLIEPMAFGPTDLRPFGHSRITRTVMSITDDAIREEARSEIAAEFAALPQKWITGTYAKLTATEQKKYNAAMGAVLELTKDIDGDSPNVGQFPQISMQPHIDYMRSLAARFSGATNVPLSSLGVVSDNPSSAEAIYAAKEDLVIDAQNLNDTNGLALRNVAWMCLAVLHRTDFATERDAGTDVAARFRNPAIPSVVSQSDAMVKQVSAIPWLAESDVALEELGYSGEQIQRLRSDRRRSQSAALYTQAAVGAGMPGYRND